MLVLGLAVLAGCPTPPPLPVVAGDLEWLDDGTRAVRRCDDVTVELTPFANSVRVRYLAQDDDGTPDRSFAVVGELPAALGPVLEGERLSTEAWAVEVDAACRLTTWNGAGEQILRDVSWTAPATLVRTAPQGERYYGLGERNAPMQHRGRTVTFWNTDAYNTEYGGYAPDQDPLYQSIPLLLGLSGGSTWGVFTDNAHRMTLDLADADPTERTWSATAGRIDQWVFFGDSSADVLDAFTELTGRAARPPRWALGYHQCRWGYSDADRVREIAAGFRSRGIPADAMWLDIQHLDGFRTFTWDPQAFPDPAGLTWDLATEGFATVVIADPGIKAEPGWDVYDSGLAADVFLREASGELATGVVWAGESVFPDFTDPAARAWWLTQVSNLGYLGVRGIWLDVNEPTAFPESGGGASIPDDVPVVGDGIPTTMAEAHNVYAMGEAEATYSGLAATHPDRPFVLSRAGYAGMQRHAATWTGDVPSSWDGLRTSLPMMLNLGVSGQPMVGTDIGGYSGDPGPELFARWMQLGVISPFARGHVTNGAPDQEPWSFGTEVEDISRSALAWRYRLLPYFEALIDRAVTDGSPVLAPLWARFPDDGVAADIGDQGMLGEILVAPVLDPAPTDGEPQVRRVYLPTGRWFDLLSGAAVDGPVWVEKPVTLAGLPMWAQEGALIPWGPDRQWTGEQVDESLRIDVYPQQAEPSALTLYDDADAGPRWQVVSAQRDGSATIVELGAGTPPDLGGGPVTLRFIRADTAPTAVRVDGVELPESTEGPGWSWDDSALAIDLRLAGWDWTRVEVEHDATLAELAPPVRVDLTVTVPSGTPSELPVHVVSDANGWTHQALDWVVPGEVATGTLEVPRGQWFFLKYTRGDWCTVEKWPDCEEASNRYAYGKAGERQDTVFGWRDWCEACE